MIAFRCSYIYIYIILISWEILVKDDSKAPFSIAITSRYRRVRYTFPWIAAITLDLYLIMLSVKQGGIKYYFLTLFSRIITYIYYIYVIYYSIYIYIIEPHIYIYINIHRHLLHINNMDLYI